MLVQKKTISAQVADAIRQRILVGDYEANLQLRQEHLATEFGVSRIPVREALHQLHSEGFVTLVSHKGAVVSSISLDEILELFELRARIETWLLGLAIPRMSEADMALAREHARRHQEQGRTGENSNQLNWNFHAALYAPSGRKATIELVGRIYQQLERYTRMMVSLTEIQTQSDRDHWQLIQLCEAKDTLRAVSLLETHIITSGKFLVDRLQELRGS
jgi:DNA-binding GntR family transcriptional regulator